MNKEKQIEEMESEFNAWCDGVSMDICATRECTRCCAEVLTEKGYRKASEVAREIFEDCHNTLIKILNTVRDGLDKAIREDNEDAKLVHIGTEETVKCIILIFAELKKKYTEQ